MPCCREGGRLSAPDSTPAQNNPHSKRGIRPSRAFITAITKRKGNQMPDCRAINKKLGRYFDGELPPIERRSVDDHLERCSRCRTELQGIREVVDAFQEGISVPPVPSDLAQRIMGKARTRVGIASAGWGLIWFWKKWSFSMCFAAVAVAAAACYIGIVIGGASPPSVRQTGDEMRWIDMSSRGPIVTAYEGSTR